MSAASQLQSIPGKSGPEEAGAAQQGGGFGWSRQRAAEFGPVCRTTFRGEDAVLLTGETGMRAFYDTALVARAAAKTPADVAFVSDGVTPVVPVLDGEVHVERKSSLLTVVTKDALDRYAPILEAVIARHLAQWEVAGSFDAKAALKALAFEALSTVILGAPGDAAMAADYASATAGAFGAPAQDHLPARDRLLARYRQALAAQRRRSADDASSSMVGILAHSTQLGDEQIVAEVQHIFIGSGGMWVGSCCALALLAEHPDVLARVRQEVRGLSAPSSLAQLEGLGYLQRVIEEVLRKTPIINTQIGRAARSFEIDGHRVHEGTLLVAGLYATNHDGVVYPAPDVFDPDRLERSKPTVDAPACPFSTVTPFTFVPFGGGDRSTGHRCLGENLVYLALKLVLAKLAQRYAWALAEPELVGKMPAAYMAPDVRITLTMLAA